MNGNPTELLPALQVAMAMDDLPATLRNFFANANAGAQAIPDADAITNSAVAVVVEEPASKKIKTEAKQKVTLPDWCLRAIAAAQASVAAMGPGPATMKPAVTWTIKECFAKQIFEGQKVYEGVSATKKQADKLFIGCDIGFHWYRPVTLIVKVVSLQKFDSVRGMLETLGSHSFLPLEEGSGEEDVLERCVKVYENLGIKGPMLAIGLDAPKLNVKPDIDIATLQKV